MLNKDSIESAIILAKLLRKTNKAIVEPQEGTLVSMVLKESELLTMDIDYSMSDIDEGNHGELVDKIYRAHEARGNLNDEGIEMDIDDHHIHESWMGNYSRDIARSIENNLEFVKLVVIPQIKEVYDSLIEIYNDSIVNVDRSFFIIKDVTVPTFVASECFLELVKEHSDHDAKERVDINHQLSLNADNPDVILEYLHKGANKLGFIADLQDISPGEKLEIVSNYLSGCKAENPVSGNLSLVELLVLVSFFAGVIESPYFNSGSSGSVNAQWADYHLHVTLNDLNYKVSKVMEELKRGCLVSSITPNMNSIYPRPSADGEMIEVSCYLSNFEGIETTLSPDELIAALCVSNIPLNEITNDYFTSENVQELNRVWAYFLSNISSTTAASTIHKFEEKACKFLGEFRSRVIDTKNRPVKAFDNNFKIESEEEIYRLAKDFVVEYIYWNTNAGDLVDILQQDLNTDKEVELVTMNVVVRLISKFLLRQAIIVEDY